MTKQYKVVLVEDEDHPTGIELQNLENEDDKILTTDDGGFFVDEVYPLHQIQMTKVKVFQIVDFLHLMLRKK